VNKKENEIKNNPPLTLEEIKGKRGLSQMSESEVLFHAQKNPDEHEIPQSATENEPSRKS
jgi:hypothetical protein